MVATNLTGVARIRFDLIEPINLVSFDNNRVGSFFPNAVLAGGEIGVPAGQPGVNGGGTIFTTAWCYQGPNGTARWELEGTAFDQAGNEIPGVEFLGGTLTGGP